MVKYAIPHATFRIVNGILHKELNLQYGFNSSSV